MIDVSSEEVMLRIEASMSRLKVMGDDDRRFFWIWAQVNNRERAWLQVLTEMELAWTVITVWECELGKKELPVQNPYMTAGQIADKFGLTVDPFHAEKIFNLK